MPGKLSPPPRSGGERPTDRISGKSSGLRALYPWFRQARVSSPWFGMPWGSQQSTCERRSRILIYHRHNELAVKTRHRHQQFHRHALFLQTNPHFCSSETHKSPSRRVAIIYLATGCQREESLSSHCIRVVGDRQWLYVVCLRRLTGTGPVIDGNSAVGVCSSISTSSCYRLPGTHKNPTISPCFSTSQRAHSYLPSMRPETVIEDSSIKHRSRSSNGVGNRSCFLASLLMRSDWPYRVK